MPVTARLSKRFYDQFGDETANELVEWFNLVDATYKADLRELNERIFARFDARLEQRLADFRAELRTEMHTGFAELRAQMDSNFLTLRAHTDTGLAGIRNEIRDARADLLKWSFLFWVGAVGAIAGLAGVLR